MATSVWRSAGANIRDKILDYSDMRPYSVKGNGLKAFTCKYRIAKCFTMNAQGWNKEEHTSIGAVRLLQRWRERTDTLWWSVLGHIDIGKRIVRSHSARRLRMAFVESLRKQGYAPDGSCLPEGQQRKALFGTVGMGATKDILKMKNEEVIAQTDQLLTHVINSQDGGGSRQKASNSSRSSGRPQDENEQGQQRWQVRRPISRGRMQY